MVACWLAPAHPMSLFSYEFIFVFVCLVLGSFTAVPPRNGQGPATTDRRLPYARWVPSPRFLQTSFSVAGVT